MKNSMQLKALMRNYSKEYRTPAQAVLQEYEYAREISFESVMNAVDTLGRLSDLGVAAKDA